MLLRIFSSLFLIFHFLYFWSSKRIGVELISRVFRFLGFEVCLFVVVATQVLIISKSTYQMNSGASNRGLNK